MKRCVAALGLVLCLAVALPAQSTGEPYIRAGVTLGLCWAGYRETTYSTILQRLDSSRLVVNLDIGGGSLAHRVSFGLTMGRTHSSVSDQPTIARFYDEYTGEPIILADPSHVTAIKAHLAYGLVTPVVAVSPYTGEVGGAVRLEALIQVANYPSITALISLAPLYRQSLTLGPLDRLSLDLSAPLLTYAVRPPWAGVDAALMQTAARNPLALFLTGTLLSLGRHQALYADLSYVHTVAPVLDLEYDVTASLSRVAFPLPRTDAELSLRAGAVIGE